MSSPVFRAESICKTFGNQRVLKSASIWATAGQITVVFGRNGCGKSTLLRICAGLTRADTGMVHFSGAAFERPRLHVLARLGLFFLPERGLLVGARTLRYHFDALRKVPGTANIDETIERLALAPFMNVQARELSGGELRRAELAITLARRPVVLLADEPFQGITPKDAEEIGKLFRDLAATGCAIIATGHEVPQLMHIADEIIWMTAGTTASIGNALDARMHAQFRREYAGRSF